MLSVKKTSRVALQFTMLSALASCGFFGGHSGGSSGNGNPPGTDDSAPGAAYLGGAVVGSVRLTPPGATSSTTDLGTSDTVACIDLKTGLATRIEVFDFYENQELTPRPLSLGPTNSDPWARAQKVVERLKTNDPHEAETLSKKITWLSKNFHELPSAKILGLPPKETSISLAANCFFVKTSKVANSGMIVDSEIWHAMNSDQQVGIILREALNIGRIPTRESMPYHVTSAANLTSSSLDDIKLVRHGFGMSERQSREHHVNLVATDGFLAKAITEYVEQVRNLGQFYYAAGSTYFLLAYDLTFYDNNPQRPKLGYAGTEDGKEAETAATTEQFSEVELRGPSEFYANGRLAKTRVNKYTDLDGGDRPDDVVGIASTWKLKDGSNLTLLDKSLLTFNEQGALIGLEGGPRGNPPGYFSQPFSLKVDYGNMSINMTTKNYFRIIPGQPFICGECTGTLKVGGVELNITKITVTGTNLNRYYSGGSKITVKFADGVTTDFASSVDYDMNNVKEIMFDNSIYDISCHDPGLGVSNVAGVSLNESGFISNVIKRDRTSEPLPCTNYQITKRP